jgi:hypothetical protein
VRSWRQKIFSRVNEILTIHPVHFLSRRYNLKGQAMPADEGLRHRVPELAATVHGATGRSLYPSAYEEMLCIELTRAGILFQKRVHVPSMYDGVNLGDDLCADLLVGDDLIVEALAVDEI